MHDSTRFSWTGLKDEPENLIYNQPLEANTGDEEQSMNLLANNFKHLPILFGGAGGYLPDTFTPLVWKEAIKSLAEVE